MRGLAAGLLLIVSGFGVRAEPDFIEFAKFLVLYEAGTTACGLRKAQHFDELRIAAMLLQPDEFKRGSEEALKMLESVVHKAGKDGFCVMAVTMRDQGNKKIEETYRAMLK